MGTAETTNVYELSSFYSEKGIVKYYKIENTVP
jgi:hypothetical protein